MRGGACIREIVRAFQKRKAIKWLLFTVLAILCVRYMSDQMFQGEYDWSLLLRENGQTPAVSVSGTVDEVRKTDYGAVCTVGRLNGRRFSVRLLLYLPSAEHIEAGDIVEISGVIRSFAKPANDGEWNAAAYYRSMNVVGYMDTPAVLSVKRPDVSLSRVFSDLSGQAASRLMRTSVWCAQEMKQVLAAMVFGGGAEVDEQLRQTLAMTGIVHILSISGLHISCLGWFCYRLFSVLTRHELPAAIGAVGCMVVYVCFVGTPLSALRALVMFSYALGAKLAGRTADQGISLAFALACVLCWRPFSFTQSGFLFSFGAVCSIYCYLACKTKKKIHNTRSPVRKLINSCVDALCVSVFVFFGTLPISLSQNFYVSPYSILFNLLVIPTVSILMFCSVLSFLAGFFGPALSSAALSIGCLLMQGIVSAAEWILTLPGAVIVCGCPAIVQCLFYYGLMGGGLFLYFRKRRSEYGAGASVSRLRRFFRKGCFVIAAVCTCAVLMIRWTSLFAGSAVTMLDVGQGDGFVMTFADQSAYLIDGGSSDHRVLGENILEPFLMSRGITDISCAFVSHGDEDHISGLMYLLQKQRDQIYAPVKIRSVAISDASDRDDRLRDLRTLAIQAGAAVCEMAAGDQMASGHAFFFCLYPRRDAREGDANEASMVLSVRGSDGFSVLFTGDIGQQQEREVIELAASFQYSLQHHVLKAAHHGSKTSSSKEFLNAVCPQIVLLSCGQNNRYGHPHRETMERLLNQTGTVLQTARLGQVGVRFLKQHAVIEAPYAEARQALP